MKQNSWDVLVVGGGPAGLAAGIALRMKGADVLVADALKPPIDKACGEGLMPDARRDLGALGVHCDPAEGAPFRGIQFVNWAECEPVSVMAHFAHSEGIGMRRTVLHARLVERALELGVRLRWNTHVALAKSVTLDGEACSYRYLVGADGQSSKVRRWARLDSGWFISRRFGFRRHYRIPQSSNNVEVHWCAPGQVYITPVGRDEICVAAVTRHSSTRMQQIIDTVPHLRERLSGNHAFAGERGALTTTRKLRHVVMGNIALVGDASGSVDAVTGEGLAIGFREAHLLSRSLERGSLDLYAAEHEQSLKMPRRMAHALLLMDVHPLLRNLILRSLANSPDAFDGLLQVHLGEETLSHLLLHQCAAMVKRLARSGTAATDTERTST